MAAGVFTSRDTYAGRIQDILSQNRYTYAKNNPVTYADPSGHISIKSAWNAVKTGAKAVASAVTAAVKTGAAAVSNTVKSVISKPTVSLGNTSRSSGGTASAYAKVSGVVQNQAAQKKAAKSAAWADFVGQPLTVCEAAAAWADWGAEKAAGYMDESLWGPGLMVGAYEVEAIKCFAYSQLENSIHLIIPEADVERMLRGAGLMIGGAFKSYGGFMLTLGGISIFYTGIGILGAGAGIFVTSAGASDMNQGAEEFFLGLSGDSTTQTRNGMSDLFYDGNDGIYHLSTGVAAFAGSLLTPYVACAAKTATAGSAAGNGGTAGTTTAGEATVTEAAGGTVDDALEQFYDDIFESSYGEQFDPIKEQAIAGIESVEGGSKIGADRAAQYSGSWQSGSVKDAINRFAPDATPTYTDSGKIIFRNEATGIEVVYDRSGNYYRIIDTNLSGRRTALDIDGNIVPNNVQTEQGTMRGMTQSEYNATTHFNNTDLSFDK